ncbi:salicylate hydroxylase-2 [Coleophoma cylindrospora]|uniref:Salicylate hydroxylase-2 n=1 Tax=Coleophoma cylindrospora TaxID=1849047 RepID=A0A3D8RTM8_9HELO|nr:salicylate hydroxylase-2 [Coleophoma cylindrospora]
MPSATASNIKSLNVAIIGSGLGGLSAAVALRRQGHQVTVYERYDFANEVGASLSVASNGSRFLEQWKVDIPAVKPVILQRLIMHDWATGEVKGEYPLGDYKAKFGTEYFNFHRIDMHNVLLDTVRAKSSDEFGPQGKVVVNHKAIEVVLEKGFIRFENGETTTADLIIAADGIRSLTRENIGIKPQVEGSTSCCYRCIIPSSKLHELGLSEFVTNNGIEFWGGFGINKIVMSPCHDVDRANIRTAHNGLNKDGWNISATPQELADTYPDLDPRVVKLFLNANDIKMWRLYIHQPYPYWTKGKVALLGDAAHPMLPDQSQGYCMALEDAGALGYIFSEEFQEIWRDDVSKGLKLYERVRKDRASRVQAASARARTDLSERIGWSSSSDKPGKLTIEEVCGYNLLDHIRELVKEGVA